MHNDYFHINSYLDSDLDPNSNRVYWVKTVIYFYDNKVNCSFTGGDLVGIRPVSVYMTNGRALTFCYYGIETNDALTVSCLRTYDDCIYFGNLFNCLMREMRSKYV